MLALKNYHDNLKEGGEIEESMAMASWLVEVVREDAFKV